MRKRERERIEKKERKKKKEKRKKQKKKKKIKKILPRWAVKKKEKKKKQKRKKSCLRLLPVCLICEILRQYRNKHNALLSKFAYFSVVYGLTLNQTDGSETVTRELYSRWR